MAVNLPLTDKVGFFTDISGVSEVAGRFRESASIIKAVVGTLPPVKIRGEGEGQILGGSPIDLRVHVDDVLRPKWRWLGEVVAARIENAESLETGGVRIIVAAGGINLEGKMWLPIGLRESPADLLRDEPSRDVT